ncbi:Uncharacterised protein [Mycobacterium tuberculosis]|nr:Uncharacterised protein [Mycobacterium tuberculosis]CFB32445.1 Uncharacterised protein [Mycobacterium tuberculosis]CFB38252.1 Uncharacterised protein [Mycobacterium tuberculosis]CFB42242.1 Uncharacterised protein [Mycobacterium tuberculosis]CFC71179.1 Uncharacterised protein [Mycobacterium tuberculosis]
MWGCPKIFAGGDSHGSSWLSSSLWRSSFSWWWKVLVRGWPWSRWGGGSHSVWPWVFLRVVQPFSASRLSGSQARVRSVMSVRPVLVQAVTWWAWLW